MTVADQTPEQIIADALDLTTARAHGAVKVVAALRAAGLLPGPADIVVSREAHERRERLLQEYDIAFDNLLGAHAEVRMDTDEDRALHSRAMSAFTDLQTTLRAALSQPHLKETS